MLPIHAKSCQMTVYAKFLLFFLFLITCSFLQDAHAQELRALIVEEVSGPPVIQTEYPDKATIIIQTTIPNLEVQSSLIILENRSTPENGRYEYVVEPRRQQLIVNAAGFTETVISILSLQEREFKYYDISPTAPQYPLSLTANMTGARAFANDSLLGETPLTSRLEAGRYTIRVEAEGYADASRVIDLQEAMRLSFNLQPQVYELTVTSNPGDAQIRVNNVDQGRTSSILELRRGVPYAIEIIKDGYYPWKKDITIERNEVLSADLVSTAEAAPSTLLISSIPTGARVFVNNQYAGSAPMEQVVRPGSYTVRLEAEGFTSLTETVDVSDGAEQRLQFTLEPEEQALTITSEPAGARVLLNGFEAGTTPYTGSFPPGFVTLRLELEGYDPIEEAIDIQDEPVTRNFTMQGNVMLVSDADAAAFVRNVQLTMQDNLVTVSYALANSDATAFQTSLLFSDDGGASFREVQGATGDVGKGIPPGNEKQISWNYLSQFPSGFPQSGIQLKVTASIPKKANNRLLYIIGGAVLVGGGGAAIALLGDDPPPPGGGATIASGPPGRPTGQ